jgi:hypothetical protein
MTEAPLATAQSPDAAHRQWIKDFMRTSEAIPASWIVTTEDGSTWINPEHAGNGVVHLYRELCLVGFARGWLR